MDVSDACTLKAQEDKSAEGELAAGLGECVANAFPGAEIPP